MQGIAPDRQHDVREDQVEARVAVPAVPHGQAVEAEQPLHRRQAGEQQHLQQRRVGPEQPGDPGEARQELAGAEVVGDVAAVHPEADHQGRVPGHERPQDARERDPASRARARERGDAR